MGTLKGDCRIDDPSTDYCNAHGQMTIECMKQGSKRIGVAYWSASRWNDPTSWDVGLSGARMAKVYPMGCGGGSVTIGSGGAGGGGTVVAQGAGGGGGYSFGRPSGISDVMRGGLCTNCGGSEWVCETHTNKPWGGKNWRPDACDCGAGAPCPSCNSIARLTHEPIPEDKLRQVPGWHEAAADKLMALNNSSPRLPTKEQIILTLRSV